MADEMKVLLFGANGQVGFECIQRFQDAGFDLVALSRQDVDLSHLKQVQKAVIEHQPQLVINATAYTAVDKAESEPELAAQINHFAVEAMAKACQKLAIPLFHISTDYVFDGKKRGDGEKQGEGEKEGAYRETDPVNPQGVYGQTKLDGERAIQNIHPEHIILRTAWVFGPHGQNFVKTMLRLGAERDSLGVVADQRGCPTYAGDIAQTLLNLAKHYRETQTLPWGLYHYCGDSACSWYEFASTIFTEAAELRILAKPPVLNPITTSDYPTPAKRPSNSVLDCSKVTSAGLGVSLSNWKRQLKAMLSNNYTAS